MKSNDETKAMKSNDETKTTKLNYESKLRIKTMYQNFETKP